LNPNLYTYVGNLEFENESIGEMMINSPIPQSLRFLVSYNSWKALILYGYLIPISLYVSIEVVKVLQAMLINKDTEMYDEETYMSNERRKMKVTYLPFHIYQSS
jgi:magnesium-transporting ATPase (P-type)